MHAHARLIMGAAALVGVAACGRSAPSPTDDLRRDLELARGQGLELAPRSGQQTTVSAAELVPQGSSTSATPASRQRVRTPVIAAAPKARTVVEAPTRQPLENPAPVSDAPTKPQPATGRPAVNPPPPGGYKTMGELIRKAPFPINP